MKDRMKLTDLLPRIGKELSVSICDSLKGLDTEPEKVEVKRVASARKIISLEEGSRTAVQYFTTRTLDRDGEILLPGGAVMDQFKQSNMQVFWNHDYNQLIGSDTKIKKDDFGWLAWTQYAKHEDPGAKANIIWELKQQGHLKTNSVGFAILAYTQPGHNDWTKITDELVLKWPEFTRKIKDSIQRIITKYMVIEHSDVGVASNVDSNMLAIAKNYANDADLEKMFGVELKDFPTGDPKIIKESKAESFNCECIECGHKMKSEKHCKDFECPECGGEMRREERPGPGDPKEAPKPIVKRASGIIKPRVVNIKVHTPKLDIDALGKIVADAVKNYLDISTGKV